MTVTNTLNRCSRPHPIQIKSMAALGLMSSVFYSQRVAQSLTHHQHICLFSNLTGSKFSGNRSALISFPHTADRHLITRARTQNLCHGKKMDSLVCCLVRLIFLHVFFIFIFVLSPDTGGWQRLDYLNLQPILNKNNLLN